MNRSISVFSLPVLLAGLVLMHRSSPSESDSADYSALPRQLTPEEIELAASADRFGLKLSLEVVRQEAEKTSSSRPYRIHAELFNLPMNQYTVHVVTGEELPAYAGRIQRWN